MNLSILTRAEILQRLATGRIKGPTFDRLCIQLYRQQAQRIQAMKRQRETDYWRQWANAHFAHFKN